MTLKQQYARLTITAVLVIILPIVAYKAISQRLDALDLPPDNAFIAQVNYCEAANCQDTARQYRSSHWLAVNLETPTSTQDGGSNQNGGNSIGSTSNSTKKPTSKTVTKRITSTARDITQPPTLERLKDNPGAVVDVVPFVLAQVLPETGNLPIYFIYGLLIAELLGVGFISLLIRSIFRQARAKRKAAST